jgi:hypothetical protein
MDMYAHMLTSFRIFLSLTKPQAASRCTKCLTARVAFACIVLAGKTRASISRRGTRTSALSSSASPSRCLPFPHPFLAHLITVKTAAWSCAFTTQHGHASLTFAFTRQHGHASLTFAFTRQHGHASLTFAFTTQHGHASLTFDGLWHRLSFANIG